MVLTVAALHTRRDGDLTLATRIAMQVVQLDVMGPRLGDDEVLGSTLLPLFPHILIGGHVFEHAVPLVSGTGATLAQLGVVLQFLPEGAVSATQAAEAAANRTLSLAVRVRRARNLKVCDATVNARALSLPLSLSPFLSLSPLSLSLSLSLSRSLSLSPCRIDCIGHGDETSS